MGSRTDDLQVAMVTIAILAVIAGADGFVAIET
ncbi:MAG: transposase family protein [Moorea sp. SIO4E2]|nr:transposase family protein [Moorena sp. SIO4E2]